MDSLKALFDHLKAQTPDFSKIEIQLGCDRLAVERQPVAAAAPAAAPAPVSAAPAVLSASPAPAEAAQAGKPVKSPIVGTFYAAPSPEAPPFVAVGAKVRAGQVLCIIEAMKMMNEIECESDGVISAVCVQNGDLVEYGQPLFMLAEG